MICTDFWRKREIFNANEAEAMLAHYWACAECQKLGQFMQLMFWRPNGQDERDLVNQIIKRLTDKQPL
jgi:hypothetical protein